MSLNEELSQINLEFTEVAIETQRRVRCLNAHFTKWLPNTII